MKALSFSEGSSGNGGNRPVIKLILFDLDGTLVNSIVDITNALNYAIEPHRLEKMTVEKTAGLVGEGLTRLIEEMLGSERAELRNDVLDRFVHYYSEHLVDFTRPYPGVVETLKALAGYRKAVISNKRESLSRRLLEELRLVSYFDIIFGSDSVEEKKPSPRPILRILEMLDLHPESAVIVGDSNFDIEAGRAAGIWTVAVTYGYRDASLLQGADVMIADIRELPSRLRDIGSGRVRR
jgi:phosphoglycolate phosphatase